MKDIIKTVFSVLVVMIILIIVLFAVENAKYGIEQLKTTNLDLKDPTVQILYDRVKDNTNLRKAQMISEDLTSQEIIYFTISNLTADDYTSKTVKHEKIVCQVTNTIKFYSDSDCKIRIIKNSVFYDYQKKYFGTGNELLFDDFSYYGYDCQNDGEKYYCNITKYSSSVLGYSSFASAYKIDDEFHVKEYYIQIDLSDSNRCLIYFNEEYCNNYLKLDKPTLADKTIIGDGVLYEHIFVKVDDAYYLKSSSVVEEG